jgi:hypothetical protein
MFCAAASPNAAGQIQYMRFGNQKEKKISGE